MNWKTWAPLAFAIVLGLIAAKVGHDVVTRSHGPDVQNAKLTKVVVAKVDVTIGAALKESDLTLGPLPIGTVPAGAFTNPADVVGRVVLTPLVKGQTILDTLLAAAGSASGLTAIIPEGMRAITIEVNEFSGLACLLVPGCRVDVVATLNAEEQSHTTARTVAENLKVIAVGRR